MTRVQQLKSSMFPTDICRSVSALAEGFWDVGAFLGHYLSLYLIIGGPFLDHYMSLLGSWLGLYLIISGPFFDHYMSLLDSWLLDLIIIWIFTWRLLNHCVGIYMASTWYFTVQYSPITWLFHFVRIYILWGQTMAQCF